MSRKLVISPSGNFYGSEQVLFDYLLNTQIILDVAVPRKSLLFEKLKEARTIHNIRQYNNKRLPAFYTSVFWKLLTGRYNLVYLNEAGHIRYITILGRLFKMKKFIVHVRMVEDTNASRWKRGIPANMTVLAISKYISELLPVKNSLLYDAYSFSDNIWDTAVVNPETLKIAIIGRITKTKGIGLLPRLLDLIQKSGCEGKYIFELYGEISDDLYHDELLAELRKSNSVVLKGFEVNKESIYLSVNCILHLSSQEALGRIFFEALDHYKPLIGFKAAGIGEIAELLGLSQWLADPRSAEPAREIYELLKGIKEDYESQVLEAKQKKIRARQIFNPVLYQIGIDKLFS